LLQCHLEQYPLVALFCLPFLLSFDISGDESIQFTAYTAEDKVNIQWTSEVGSYSYVLMRSRDGKEYEDFRSITLPETGPEIMDFLESDFKPLMGWSYYRIKKLNPEGKASISHVAPVFFRGDRMKKGQIIDARLPNSDEVSTTKTSLMEFDNKSIVLVLRSKTSEEFYCEGKLYVRTDKLFMAKSETLSAGDYSITSASKDELVGLNIVIE